MAEQEDCGSAPRLLAPKNLEIAPAGVAPIRPTMPLFQKRIDRGQSLVEAILCLGVAHEVDAFNQDLARRGRLLEKRP